MSLKTRKEIIMHIQKRYLSANWKNKQKILDELTTTTGYSRKYAVTLLNQNSAAILSESKKKKQQLRRKYGEDVYQALLIIWNAANQICSKRLAPFIPELLLQLERYGHLSVPHAIRNQLVQMSPATIDRLLQKERRESKKRLSTTRPGSLLKKQIKIRTFADWDEVVPGFLEGDLVAHCGDRVDGAFLNSLVLTDIASTWTEFFPILNKGEAGVIAALQTLQQLLTFPLLGLDTDNGCEFINYKLLGFCQTNHITFTRSRAYKKNDQAHVEERNGSIIRKLVGYDRYEGLGAYHALSELYSVLRLYVNFFQPSLKLISKQRVGAKVSKRYDKAQTPCQRLLQSPHISHAIKAKLKRQYETIDPLMLLQQLKLLQDNFWKHAWQPAVKEGNASKEITSIIKHIDVLATVSVSEPQKNSVNNNSSAADTLSHRSSVNSATQANCESSRHYKRTNKPMKDPGPRTWRSRPDPFEHTWSSIQAQLELNPARTAVSLLADLMQANAAHHKGQLRTLQRRVTEWRAQQRKMHLEQNYPGTATENAVRKYVTLVAHAITNG